MKYLMWATMAVGGIAFLLGGAGVLRSWPDAAPVLVSASSMALGAIGMWVGVDWFKVLGE